MARNLTIGELSHLTGVSVKRLRFYSDEGLLPPLGRSRGGYRLYGDEHIRRIELVRLLRDAGMGLGEITRVLRRDVSLGQALELRLEAVETHIAGLERVASALRLAIRSGATEEQLRRITMATRATNEDRRRVVAAFLEKVCAGIPVPRDWLEGMVAAGAPDMPETPTAEQIAAWIEIESLLDDPKFLACRRANTADTWVPSYDRDAFVDAQIAAMTSVADARTRGIAPSDREAQEIVDRFTSTMTDASRGRDEALVREHMRTKFDPRGARYWELVSIMRADPPPTARFDDWRWFGQALSHRENAA